MSKKSEIISELLSIKIKRINDPCKPCLVKTACIIYKCSFIKENIARYHPNHILLSIVELAQIIDIVHDVKLDFGGIIKKAEKCQPHNLFIHKHKIRNFQNAISNGITFPKKPLEFLLEKYKELNELTKN
jgi:hypothetical protein